MTSAELRLRGRSAWARLRARAAGAGRVLHRLVGAPDYEAYVRHARTHHPGTVPLSRHEFIAMRLDERYSRPGAKCC